MTSIHLPVLLEPILCEWLDSLLSAPDRGPITIVDGTFGGGGHSLQIARRLKEGDTLIGIDRDPLPIARFIRSAPSANQDLGSSSAVAAEGQPPTSSVAGSTQERVDREERWVEYSAVLPSGCRLVLSCASYCALPEILKEIGQSQVHGILLDLGLSSDQLDDSQRGFSFRLDAPLDLRFNPTLGISASDWLLKHSEQQIADAIYQYGEERFSRRIARAIVERNRTDPITTSKELADLIHRVIPGRIHGRVDSATRTFQALRIAVNRELEHVQRAMELMPDLLAAEGLLAVISFHSLEDRIVKHAVRDDPRLEVVTKKPIVASDAEVDENPRSRSAKLRIARRASELGR
jgi:16S rRNA (cytosine1402-N4)-methyltransferase